MSVVEITFNKDRDLYNIWSTCNREGSFGIDFREKINPKVLEMCRGKEFDEIKGKLEQHYSHIYESDLMKVVVKSFIEAWNKIETEYFKRLEKMTGKKFPAQKIMAFLTTTSRCPYNPDLSDTPHFFMNFFAGIPNAMKTCGHELMHIHFHNTDWAYVEKEIGNEKTKDLKEALTVLLNLEFKDLLIVYDEGYPKHRELREFIEKQWKKEKNFKKLLDECISYLK